VVPATEKRLFGLMTSGNSAGPMGHSSEEMMKKHYAKIIPEDRPNVAKIISEIADFYYGEDESLEVPKRS
jgi:hypothetical protein